MSHQRQAPKLATRHRSGDPTILCPGGSHEGLETIAGAFLCCSKMRSSSLVKIPAFRESEGFLPEEKRGTPGRTTCALRSLVSVIPGLFHCWRSGLRIDSM